MLYGGAKGDTEAQMADCLVFNLPQAFVHSGFNYLDLALSSRAKLQDNPGNPEISGDIFNLNISNAIWLQQGYPVLSDYLDNLALNYGAGIYLLDFMTQPEPSRLAINEWVARQTEDRIQNLLPAKSIDILTRMVLTNTIYFNAYWVDPFKVENTKAEPFYPLSDSAVTADMMHQTEYFRYAVGDNYQAVELPYWSDQKAMAMVLLVPDAGQFEAFEAGLNGNQIASINSQLQSTYIDLAMPKWEYRSSFNLKAVLSDLGMTDVFIEELADLSGINGHRELFASDVIHQAFVKVNEAGTEAAAATAIPVAGSGLPPVPVEVNIDRPFIFLIHDRPTGTVIFLGRVLDPS
jgi:serpin B